MECLPHLRDAWSEMAASQSAVPAFSISLLVCSGLFAFLVFPPKWDLVCISTRKICWTAGICHFEHLHQYRCSCYRGRMASGYNRVDCPSRKQPPYFYCFVSLAGGRFGIHRRVFGWNPEAPHDKASFSGTILCVP